VILAFKAGELVTEDFRRLELSRMSGELVLDELEAANELVLMVRSSSTGSVTFASGSASGKREYQLSEAITASPWNMGDVSKLSVMKGDSPISGEVRSVNVVEGGTEPRGSWKISLGETVRVEPEDGALIDVNADPEKSQFISFPNAGPRPAPRFESNELLLLRSAMFTAFCGIRLLLVEENRGTGGRCCRELN
jgi:hypothetical protein